MELEEKCPTCNGSGREPGGIRCETCDGKLYVPTEYGELMLIFLRRHHSLDRA
jgi:DnaJ-class molecular chaperone